MAQRLSVMMQSPAVKLGMVAVLLLLLQVPLLMVGSLIDERQERKAEVETEFARGWGPQQTVWGPVVAVPYRWTVPPPKPGDAPVVQKGWVQAPPDRTNAAVNVTTETRRRGMFEATVYTATVALEGALSLPPPTAVETRLVSPAGTSRPELAWGEARVVLGVSRARGMGSAAAITVDGVARPLAPFAGGGCDLQYYAAPLNLSGAPDRTALPFATSFSLNGTGALQVAPMGRETAVAMQADWPTPSFLPGMMPARSSVAPAGFTATWTDASGPGAGTPADLGEALPGCRGESTAGVAFQEAVPTYQMVVRTSKYEVLFLVLAFLTYFLFEMLTSVRIHLMQYGLLGLSITLFPLLLVAVAEPAGFAVGYAVATAAVLVQASLYTLSVTRRMRLTSAFAAVLTGLFGFLYVVLSLDSYALLAGTTMLFAILSAVMLATRRLDWRGVQDA